MTGKIRTFVQVVKMVPMMLKSLWWSIENQGELESFAESFEGCNECDLSQGMEGLCDEHKEQLNSIAQNGPF